MMPCRIDTLVQARRGLESVGSPVFASILNTEAVPAGMPALALESGEWIMPLGIMDDPGFFMLYSLLYQFFPSIPSLEFPIYLFEAIRVLAFIPFVFFAIKSAKGIPWKVYVHGFFTLLIILYSYYRGLHFDVYDISRYGPLMIGSLFFLLYQRQGAIQKKHYALACLMGILIFLANVMRAHAATYFLFVGIIAVLAKPRFSKRLLWGVVLCSWLFATLGYRYYEQAMDRKVFQETALYEGVQAYRTLRHPIWHTLFVGLGFLKENPYHIVWADEFAYEVSIQTPPIGPKSSIEHERIIKQEYLRLLFQDPWFVAKTYIMKGLFMIRQDLPYWVVLVISCIALYRRRLFSAVDGLLLGGILFSCVTAIIAMPYKVYYQGFYAFFYLFLLFHAADLSAFASVALRAKLKKMRWFFGSYFKVVQRST